MTKLQLILGCKLSVVAFLIVITVSVVFTQDKMITDVQSEDLRVVKSLNEVNLLQLANDITESGISENNLKPSVIPVKLSQKKTASGNKKAQSKKKNHTKTVKKKIAGKKKNGGQCVGVFKVTAYCACVSCCGKSNGITASGRHAVAGRTIAADTSKFPFGTKLKFGGSIYTVEDTGGAIHGNRIDLFCHSHSEALRWGVRYLKVYVIR